jgi:ankyrin repeat protein
MKQLLTAIVDDDRASVKDLLNKDPQLATRHIDEAKLYDAKIFHWIYVGDTALHLAAAGYRVELVQLLLSAGADPNSIANHRRSSPLHYAGDGYIIGPEWDPTRQVKTIRCLLDAGSRINAQDKNGATPLHRAVRTRCAAAVECLLAAGADPLRKNLPGSTPFHLAVQNTGRGGSGDEKARDAQRQIIETFLSRGISVKLKDGKGKSVLEWAGSSWIRELLASGSVNETR